MRVFRLSLLSDKKPRHVCVLSPFVLKVLLRIRIVLVLDSETVLSSNVPHVRVRMDGRRAIQNAKQIHVDLEKTILFQFFQMVAT